MGNSKTIMLGAMSLLIGMYALKIKQADMTVADIGSARAQELQALELAKTGIDLAVNELTATSDGLSRTRTKTLMGGTVKYTNTDMGYGEQRVTSTATFGRQVRTMTAYLTKVESGTYRDGRKKKKWSRWTVTKMYVKPQKDNWSTDGDII